MRRLWSSLEGMSCRRARRDDGLPAFAHGFAVADTGQAVVEYALVSCVFALVMIVSMVAIQHGAGSKLNTTQVNLSGEYSRVHG